MGQIYYQTQKSKRNFMEIDGALNLDGTFYWGPKQTTIGVKLARRDSSLPSNPSPKQMFLALIFHV